MEQLKTIGRELAMGSQGGWGQSKEFLDLVKSIGEAHSKAEEDRIVLREIETLKRRIADPDVPKRKMKEYIIRLVYIEMLGHDASFGYIHAVKMTHDDSLLLKRTGYLAVTLFLSDDHDLIILIVNTIQKDLKSDNYLVVCAALAAVCKLINEETIPAVLPQVVELLGHPKEAVRKKAIMALHRFYQRSPSSVAHLLSHFRKRLCDNDPGVMGATLFPFFDLITSYVSSYKDLVVSFVSILKQVAERRLPKTYDYHQMPAPFIQIRLLKILALLGSSDKQASEHMYTVLGDIFKKLDSSSNIGNAVLYECICCVSSIYPNPKLLVSAAEVTSKFLKSDSHNLKYMGIDALGKLIKINPDIAEEHQLAVIDCLEDPDDTLKRKTFELLYKMTKSTNVEVIVDRMIDYMMNINDAHYKTEIASRCIELAEQFAPSNQWFIQTMNRVFEHAGDIVDTKVAHNFMRLIAEGFGEEDENADSLLRASAVESYLKILGEPKLPSLFIQVICWVLGEYGTADGKHSASYIMGKLCDVAEAHSNDDNVKAYVITAIMKVGAFEIAARRKLDLLPECQTLIDELSAAHSTDLQQRAYELQALLHLDFRAVESVMPIDASCEDIEVDQTLSFLNGFVQKSLEKGAGPYIPEDKRTGVINVNNFRNNDQLEPSTHSLRFEAYELPKPTVSTRPSELLAPSSDLVPVPAPSRRPEIQKQSQVLSLVDPVPADFSAKLRLDGVQKKWGRPTYATPTQSHDSSVQKPENGATHNDGSDRSNSVPRDLSYNLRKQQVEVSSEKQKLAASLFGGNSSKNGKKSIPSHKSSKDSPANLEKSRASQTSQPAVLKSAQSPPDLLDFEEPTSSISTTDDPFQQLEGLLGPPHGSSANSTLPAATESQDLMGFMDAHSPDLISSSSNSMMGDLDVEGLSSELCTPATNSLQGDIMELVKKGPNSKDLLEKDAVARHVGVTPSGRNPNLFRDLLG